MRLSRHHTNGNFIKLWATYENIIQKTRTYGQVETLPSPEMMKNGPESLHRHLNRIVYKGGSNFTLNTVAGFIQTFYKNCDEKLEKLKTGQIKNEPHKYFEVKYSIY